LFLGGTIHMGMVFWVISFEILLKASLYQVVHAFRPTKKFLFIGFRMICVRLASSPQSPSCSSSWEVYSPWPEGVGHIFFRLWEVISPCTKWVWLGRFGLVAVLGWLAQDAAIGPRQIGPTLPRPLQNYGVKIKT
jgi:hypothetical protein